MAFLLIPLRLLGGFALGAARVGIRGGRGGDGGGSMLGGLASGGSSSAGGALSKLRLTGSVAIRWDDRAFLRMVDDACRRSLEETARDVASRAQAKAPVRTGRLQRSITVGSVYATKHGYAVDVIATAPYAYYVQAGTEDTRAQKFLTSGLRGAPGELTRGLASRLP